MAPKKSKRKYLPLALSPQQPNLTLAPNNTMAPPPPPGPAPSNNNPSPPAARTTQPNPSPPQGPRSTQPLASTSQSWTSPAALQSAKFNRLQNNASHLGFSQSPFFPKTPAEFARHQAEYAQDRMEGEKARLKVRIEEREARKKGEGEAREDRALLERENGRLRGLSGGLVEGFEGMEIGGEEHGVDLQAKGKEAEILARELDDESESGDEKTEGSEQVDTGSNQSESGGKKKRKNHRGKKKSKGKNKIEGSDTTEAAGATEAKEDIKDASAGASTTKPAPKSATASKKSSAELAASLLRDMANDPLLKGVLAGTAKPPNSSLWKAFMQSPLYNPSGGGAAITSMLTSLQKPGRTTALGAPTSIWAGDEHLKPEGRRDPKTGAHRSAWPELAEMKAEGQYRKDSGKDRRLPLPRMDMMTKEAVIREAGGQEVTDMLTEAGVDAVCRDLMQKTGDEIAWMDREPVAFRGFDRLESVEKERQEDIARREKGEPVLSPGTQGRGHARGPSANMGLRGGLSQSGSGRRYTGAPLPAPFEPTPKPKVVHPEAIAYGADGPGDGKVPPPGGWVFDEEFLKQRGDWEDLLENHL